MDNSTSIDSNSSLYDLGCHYNVDSVPFEDPYVDFYASPIWILFWASVYLTVEIFGNGLLIIMMNYEKYGVNSTKLNLTNQLGYHGCATLLAANVFSLTFYATRLLLGPLPHPFGFVAFGISICLLIAELLYLVEHNIFRCLHMFEWSLVAQAFNESLAKFLAAFNFAFGAISSLLLLTTKEYETNVLYMMFVSIEESGRKCHYNKAVFDAVFVSPTVVWTLVNLFTFLCVLIKDVYERKRSASLRSSVEVVQNNVFTAFEVFVTCSTLLILYYLLIVLQDYLVSFNFQWYSSIIAFAHVPLSFFYPLVFFVSNDKRWIYFKQFLAEIHH